MLSYTDIGVRRVAGPAEAQSFRRFEVMTGRNMFNVVAAWTWEMKVGSESYRQIHRGLESHDNWVRSRPTVILGDFNMNGSFAGTRWPDPSLPI